MRKALLAAFMLVMIVFTVSASNAPGQNEMYLSTGAVLEGGYHFGGYTAETVTGSGSHPFMGLTLAARVGGDINPSTAVYGIFGADGAVDPISLMPQTDPESGAVLNTAWYMAGVNLGFGMSWKVGGNWSLGAEGWVDLGITPAGFDIGGSISFIPKYTFHIAREWFGWSLVMPLTVSMSGKGFDTKFGIGLSFEISDYLMGY